MIDPGKNLSEPKKSYVVFSLLDGFSSSSLVFEYRLKRKYPNNKAINSMITPKNVITVPLYPKYLRKIAIPNPDEAKTKSMKPLMISKNEFFI